MPKNKMRRPLPHPLANKTIGKCIYCGSTDHLTTEHVIPYGLNGVLQLYKASCGDCAKITSALEHHIVREVYGPARHLLDMRTYRNKRRGQKTSYPMLLEKNGEEVFQNIPIDDYVAMLIAPLYGYPECVAERNRAQGVMLPTGFISVGAKVFQKINAKDVELLKQEHGASKISSQINFDCIDFARFLAKIAHGYIVAAYGLESITESYVVDSILGRSQDVLRWVGCEVGIKRLPQRQGVKAIFHNVGFDVLNGEFVFWIRLFDNFANAPEYIAIVGRATETLRSHLIARGRTHA